MGMSSALDQVYHAYKYFQRDEEIDELERSSFIDSIPSTPETSIEEKKLLNRSLQFADMFNLGGGIQRRNTTAGMDSNMRMNWTRLRDGDMNQEIDSIDYKDDNGWEKLDKDSSVFVKLSKKHNKGKSNSWGKATTNIDTTAENVRETFNRDDEIDQEERNEMMGVMKNDENEVYSEEENEMVRRITEKMKSVKDDLFTTLNSPDFRTKMSIAHVEGDSNAYMKCVVNVDDESVAATNITQVSETECKIEMIFDPIPMKRKHRERSFSKPTAVIVGGKEEKRRHNETKLAVLTVRDGNHLGASFSKFLNVAATEEGAFASTSARRVEAQARFSTGSCRCMV
ncbi:hypothetical protein ScalyP_jg3684 [Parmales sp. scaly parma]|nr:hypothetical protein ScalyP_jg3684 [Parmales sp. scaly parma]